MACKQYGIDLDDAFRHTQSCKTGVQSPDTHGEVDPPEVKANDGDNARNTLKPKYKTTIWLNDEVSHNEMPNTKKRRLVNEVTDNSTDTGAIKITATNKEIQAATGSSEASEEGKDNSNPSISEEELKKVAAEIEDGCKAVPAEMECGDKAPKASQTCVP